MLQRELSLGLVHAKFMYEFRRSEFSSSSSMTDITVRRMMAASSAGSFLSFLSSNSFSCFAFMRKGVIFNSSS